MQQEASIGTNIAPSGAMSATLNSVSGWVVDPRWSKGD